MALKATRGAAAPLAATQFETANGNWSDVHIRHAGFVRCYLDSDSDKVFIATFVRQWSKTLRLAEEKRREEIDDLVNRHQKDKKVPAKIESF